MVVLVKCDVGTMSKMLDPELSSKATGSLVNPTVYPLSITDCVGGSSWKQKEINKTSIIKRMNS